MREERSSWCSSTCRTAAPRLLASTLSRGPVHGIISTAVLPILPTHQHAQRNATRNTQGNAGPWDVLVLGVSGLWSRPGSSIAPATPSSSVHRGTAAGPGQLKPHGKRHAAAPALKARPTNWRRRPGRWDELKLWAMGYKQELKRGFSGFNSFACSFALMSCFVVVGESLPGGVGVTDRCNAAVLRPPVGWQRLGHLGAGTQQPSHRVHQWLPVAAHASCVQRPSRSRG